MAKKIKRQRHESNPLVWDDFFKLSGTFSGRACGTRSYADKVFERTECGSADFMEPLVQIDSGVQENERTDGRTSQAHNAFFCICAKM